jgi:hypothetical protein
VLLHERGLIDRVVHRTTLAKAAKAAAAAAGIRLRVERGRPKRALLQANMADRVAFAEDNKTREWRHVMFTDRKRFYFRYPGCKVRGVRWSLAGKPQAAITVNKPKCVNLRRRHSLRSHQGTYRCWHHGPGPQIQDKGWQ